MMHPEYVQEFVKNAEKNGLYPKEVFCALLSKAFECAKIGGSKDVACLKDNILPLCTHKAADIFNTILKGMNTRYKKHTSKQVLFIADSLMADGVSVEQLCGLLSK